jgi:transcriptional regulator with XRE-family HTH domain
MSRISAAPDGELGPWLRFLREQSGLSQTELASTIGTDRRNIRRWEVEGHDPGGSMLMQILSALGVVLTPAPPDGIPRAVNAELARLARRLADAEDRALRRHQELVRRLEAQVAELKALAAEVPTASSRLE